MNAFLEVVAAGLAVTVQDNGRTGYRSLGIPVSGALDPWLMRAANALLGNPPDAAVLEISLVGPILKAVSGGVRIALAGEMAAEITGGVDDRPHQLAPWRTITLFPGETIRIGGLKQGVGYLALSGGIEVARQLGSRSTYRRAGIGGIDGRALVVGDRLPYLPSLPSNDAPRQEFCGSTPWLRESGPIRVIPGPQDDYFTPLTLASFLSQTFRVTPDMDRMGMRLEGERLAHGPLGADIVSDGVAPGAIQVPANGQPIILLADCQTTGGYPKIATVIRADLARLAHFRPGDAIHFTAVSHTEAKTALLEERKRLERWISAIIPFRPSGAIDEAALYGDNLVSGAIRGDESTHGCMTPLTPSTLSPSGMHCPWRTSCPEESI